MTPAANEPYDLPPGTTVGEYRIERVIGSGGMGRVYGAVHPIIAKRAAIKVLHPELSRDAEAVERFVQEARSVNHIAHPNIVDIFSFGVLPDGRTYFIMEWLRGESLRARLRRGIAPVLESLAIVDTVATALEAAHEQGIVHRDLKPDNVFLVEIKGAAPVVKLLDFGIAKLMGTGALLRTQTGNLLGTPAYISPEQARAQDVDHRTDIYALGAVLFELCTGQLVFEADNAADMIAKQLFVAPRSAAAINPAVPAALDALIVKMLAKSAAERPSLAEVRAELRTFGLQHTATPTGIPVAATPAPYTTAAPHPTPSHHATPAPYTTSAPHPTPSHHATPAPYTTSAPHPTPSHATPAQDARLDRRSRVAVVAVTAIVVIGAAMFAFRSRRGSSSPNDATSPLVSTDAAATAPLPDAAATAPLSIADAMTIAAPDAAFDAPALHDAGAATYDATPVHEAGAATLHPRDGTTRARDAGVDAKQPTKHAPDAGANRSPVGSDDPDAPL